MVEQAREDGYEVWETGLPALLTVTGDINTPRTPPLDAVIDVYRKKELTEIISVEFYVSKVQDEN